MVTIIVALASKADFTILDEPVAGLDVIAREKFYHLLLEEYEKEFLYRMLYGSQKIRNEKNSADPR